MIEYLFVGLVVILVMDVVAYIKNTPFQWANDGLLATLLLWPIVLVLLYFYYHHDE
jgi:hypothetical protein